MYYALTGTVVDPSKIDVAKLKEPKSRGEPIKKQVVPVISRAV